MKPISSESREVLLASGSPRRRELMMRIGFEPVIRTSEVPEVPEPGEGAGEYARRLAKAKAYAVAREVIDEPELPGWVLSADTIVVLDGEILEKPADVAEARQILGRLSGQRHEVITAFCWLWRAPGEGEEAWRAKVVETRAQVWMRELSEEFIARYVATGEPMDKAGSYGIQDVGSTLVHRIEGSYFCVVGLPVSQVIETLQMMGGLKDYPFDAPRV